MQVSRTDFDGDPPCGDQAMSAVPIPTGRDASSVKLVRVVLDRNPLIGVRRVNPGDERRALPDLVLDDGLRDAMGPER
ncbi:MAG TPA: hypothetical protein VGN59_15410, partial [Acidimicrobiia bacterium]